MLRVSFIGNLGGDPELRYTAKGAQVLSFSVAVNQVRLGQDGERQENTEWFRTRIMGRQVEYLSQQLGKGLRVLVFGRLDISHYQGKDGDAKTGFDVWADDVQIITRRERREEDDDEGYPGAASAPAPAAASSGRPAASSSRRHDNSDGGDLEDLPF